MNQKSRHDHQLRELQHNTPLRIVDLLEKDGRHSVITTTVNHLDLTFAKLQVEDLHTRRDLIGRTRSECRRINSAD